MKVKHDHYQTLKVAILQAQTGMESLEEYVDQHGLTDKRWRWDLLWRAKLLGFLPDKFIEKTLYDYCNDDHIDTALRQCVLH